MGGGGLCVAIKKTGGCSVEKNGGGGHVRHKATSDN